MLLHCSCQFKDYDGSPNGFGVAVFCVAKDNVECVFLLRLLHLVTGS